MKDNFTLKNIWRRLVSESPSFFKKLLWISAMIGAAGASIMLLAAQYPLAFPSDSFWVKNASHMLIIGLIGSIYTKLTVKDNSMINR